MSAGHLVRVWTDVGARKPVPLLARIEEIDGVIFTIRYLSEDSEHVWHFEEDTYEIDDDSIAEYLKTDLLSDVGFREIEEGAFVKVDSDDDYVPDSDEEDSDEETDSDEDEESEEFEDDETESEAESEESLDEE